MQGGNHLGEGRVRQGRLWLSESEGVHEDGCQHEHNRVLHPSKRIRVQSMVVCLIRCNTVAEGFYYTNRSIPRTHTR